MIRLIKSPDPEDRVDQTIVTLETPYSGTVDDMLELFTDFLRACGYSIDSLEHVRNTEPMDDGTQYTDPGGLLPADVVGAGSVEKPKQPKKLRK